MSNDIIGIDVGLKRVGIARISVIAKIGEPLGVYPPEKAVDMVKQLVLEYRASIVVVGLPKNLSQQATDQTLVTQAWVEKSLRPALDDSIEIVYHDEAFTSIEAKKRRPQGHIDDIAAAIILERYLNDSV